MECREIKSLLTAFQDHALSASEKSAVQNHLSSCGACREESEELRQSWSLLERLPGIEPSAYFKARFWEKARATQAPAPFWKTILEPALVFSAVFAVALTGILAAFQILPKNSRAQAASPLTQWAQSDPQKHGGLSL